MTSTVRSDKETTYSDNIETFDLIITLNSIKLRTFVGIGTNWYTKPNVVQLSNLNKEQKNTIKS